jgi:hypothetical protein
MPEGKGRNKAGLIAAVAAYSDVRRLAIRLPDQRPYLFATNAVSGLFAQLRADQLPLFVALIITLVAIWIESPLLVLSCAVGIVRLCDIPVMPSASILRWFPDRG